MPSLIADKERKILFENYSLVQTIFLWKDLKKCERIYFYTGSNTRLDFSNKYEKKIVLKIVRFLNPGIKISKAPIDQFVELFYTMNHDSRSLVDSSGDNIKQSGIYNTIRRLVQDDNIIKCYQLTLARLIPYKRVFAQIARRMYDEDNSLYVIPNGDIVDGFENDEIVSGLSKGRKRMLLGINCLRREVRKVSFIAIHGILPLVFVGLKLRRFTFRNIQKVQYYVRMPMVWGFPDEDYDDSGVRKIGNDGYLYNEKLLPGKIIHVFGYARDTLASEQKSRQYMSSHGIAFSDEKKFLITREFLYKWLNIYGRILFGMVRNGFYLNGNGRSIEISNRILFHILRKHLELANLDYCVEYIVRDYSNYCVISTILLGKSGKKTIATQHTGSPADLPYLSYVHVHRYIVFGELYVKLFYPYWEGMNLAKTGRMNIDWVVNIFKSPKKLSSLKERYKQLYPQRKYTALINFVTTTSTSLFIKERWDELYLGLRGLKNINIDFNLFLRFRTQKCMETASGSPFKDLPKFDERIIIDHTNFNTHELIALADLFIGQAGSFGINEAFANGKTVFSFDFTGKAGFYYTGYGKDFVLRTREDIWKVFNGLETGFKHFDCQWDLLRKDSNYHDDGRNLERIQNEVVKMVGEVKRRKILLN